MPDSCHPPRGTPLHDVLPELVCMEGDDIVIRITPYALQFATENGPALEFWHEGENRFRKVTVTDLSKWRDSVLRVLRREKENGDTLVHMTLDAAVREAYEQGEEGVEDE